jgi:hypothetical protein
MHFKSVKIAVICIWLQSRSSRGRTLALQSLHSHFQQSGAAYQRLGTFILTVIVFITSMTAVFYGFSAYYIRVSLVSEYQSQKKNIDYIFTQVQQIERDEQNLKDARGQLSELTRSASSTLINTRIAAYSSQEYKDYLESVSIIIASLREARQLLDQAYLLELNEIDFTRPDLKQAQFLASPRYKPDSLLEQQDQSYGKIAPLLPSLRQKIIMYNANWGNQLSQIELLERSIGTTLRATIREILVRNPQWASPDDIKVYGLENLKFDSNEHKEFAQDRAIIKSYTSFLGWASGMVGTPTIVSTLFVTMATGCLGGVVSFMVTAARTRREPVEETEANSRDPPSITLIRRSILGITAAIGIFLFAGSGRLVLTAQGAKSVSSGAIELSPYFVGFLAFISGFLADDAFLRLTAAGRALFQSGNKSKRANSTQAEDKTRRSPDGEQK